MPHETPHARDTSTAPARPSGPRAAVLTCGRVGNGPHGQRAAGRGRTTKGVQVKYPFKHKGTGLAVASLAGQKVREAQTAVAEGDPKADEKWEVAIELMDMVLDRV